MARYVDGFVLPLPEKTGETVVFAWIVYKSRKHRDQVNAKVMQDPRLKHDAQEMPFDGKRMAWRGFTTIVDLAAR